MGLSRWVSAAILAISPTAASAATITQHIDFSSRLPGYYQLFDRRLGTLNSVLATFSSGSSWSARITYDAEARDVTVRANGYASLYNFSGLYVLFAEEQFYSGRANTGVLYASGAAYGTSTVTYTGYEMTGFYGVNSRYLSIIDGFISVTARAAVGNVFVDGGNSSRQLVTGGSLRLVYDYTPASSVPESATWAMMIAGVGLIGASARRRRAVDILHGSTAV